MTNQRIKVSSSSWFTIDFLTRHSSFLTLLQSRILPSFSLLQSANRKLISDYIFIVFAVMSTSRKSEKRQRLGSDTRYSAIVRDIYTIFYCSPTSLRRSSFDSPFVAHTFQKSLSPLKVPEPKRNKRSNGGNWYENMCLSLLRKNVELKRERQWLRGFVWGAIIMVMVWWSSNELWCFYFHLRLSCMLRTKDLVHACMQLRRVESENRESCLYE